MNVKQERTMGSDERDARNLSRSPNGNAFGEMQSRWFDAVTHSATAISHAACAVMLAQIGILGTIVVLRQWPAADRAKPESGADSPRPQVDSTRQALEATLNQMREISDVVRGCYFDLAGEIESCARENLDTIEGALSKSRTSPKSNAE